MKKELLSPVGNFESLKMAVFYGCDAVYLGGKRFGARAFAANFTEEELKSAVFFCHLYGVKIYVTVNTMIYESELSMVIEYLGFLNQIHVDAVIMADIGLMKLAHDIYPDMEIHASTQVHIHNVNQIEILKDLGVKRVVLARELSLSEVEKFTHEMEVEIFIHGALCISYSGQCLFSSMLLNRSGNRGECAQICRLPFRLLEDGKKVETKGSYLLSTRDLNTSYKMKELLSSSVTSFKIEGRMKSPSYVGFMTHFYRKLIDEFYDKKTVSVSESDQKCVKTLFGRGFTEGCLFSKKDKDFVNQKTSNHQGICLGNIESLNAKKIGIRLVEPLNQGDGIRFVSENKGMMVNFLYNAGGQLISHAKKGALVFIDNKLGILDKGKVMKTLDSFLEQNILGVFEKKISIDMNVSVSLDGFFIEVTDGEHHVSLKEDIVSMAKTSPVTKESIEKQLRKLGDTPFVLEHISLSVSENLFVSVGHMNQIRRKAIDLIIQSRVKRQDGRHGVEKRNLNSFSQKVEIYANANTEEQLQMLLSLDIAGIYVSDVNLYQKYRKKNVIYRSNRVQHQVKMPDADEILAGESGTFVSFLGPKSVDYFFNVSNHATVDYWISKGAKKICLTPEMDDSNLKFLLSKYSDGNPLEYIIYGRFEVMVLNHCILRTNLDSKGICNLCKEHSYSLQDRNGSLYPIVMDENHRTHLFYHSNLNKIQQIPCYQKLGICKFRLEFFQESPQEIQNIMRQVKKYIV